MKICIVHGVMPEDTNYCFNLQRARIPSLCSAATLSIPFVLSSASLTGTGQGTERLVTSHDPATRLDPSDNRSTISLRISPSVNLYHFLFLTVFILLDLQERCFILSSVMVSIDDFVLAGMTP